MMVTPPTFHVTRLAAAGGRAQEPQFSTAQNSGEMSSVSQL